MWKHIASNALTLFIVILIVAAGVLAWGQRQFSGPGPLADAICLEVPRGSNMRRVSESLLGKGAISNDSNHPMGAESG